MYNFHYDYMKPKYKENINLNSFIYDIRTNTLYNDLRGYVNYHFYISVNFKQNVFKFPLMSKKVLGMMKDNVLEK